MTNVASRRPQRIKVVNAFWLGLEKIGLKPVEVLTRARLPASLTHTPFALLTTEQYFALWDALGALSRCDAPGAALADAIELTSLPPAFLAAMFARDFRNALSLVARFKSLCSPETISIAEERDIAVIELSWLGIEQAVPPALVDATFASLLRLGREGTRLSLHPKRIELAIKEPNAWRDNYFGCAVELNAAHNRLVFARADLDRAFVSNNSDMLALLEPGLEADLVERQTALSISSQVKWTVKRLIAGTSLDIESIARELGLSARTLQRRIGEEGTTFRDLLNEARRELVRIYLRDPSIDIPEVAYLLGYDDAGSFYRAFRNWEGVTPAQWRSQ